MTLETFLMTVTFVGLVYWGFCEAWQLYIAPNKSVFTEMKRDFQRLSAPLSRAGRRMWLSIVAQNKEEIR
jgi:hypothetical protein